MQRKQSIEFFRILCIVLIVIGHLCGYFHLVGGTEFNAHVLQYLGSLIFRVDAYILISGYFLINTKFKTNRVVKIFVETTFYVFFLTLISKFFMGSEVSWSDVAKSAFILAPTKYNLWFITNYLFLMLLQPFLARMAKTLTRREYQLLLCVMALLTTELISGIFPWGHKFGNGFSLAWFVSVFLFGGYIRLHGLGKNDNNSLMWGLIFLFSLFVIAASTEISVLNEAYNSPIVFIGAISGFMFFKSLKGGLINRLPFQNISKHNLSIYAIHQHPWIKMVIVSVFAPMLPSNTSPWLYPSVMLMGVIVVATCVVIDKVRMWLFDVCGVFALITKVSNWLDARIKIWCGQEL